MEGSEVSPEMYEVWRDLAASEARLTMMRELLECEVGLADIEEFGLDLHNKLRSEDFKEKSGENNSRRLVKVTLEIKMRDERKISENLRRKVKEVRKICDEVHVKNSKTYRGIFKKLRKASTVKKKEMKKIFEEKISNLKRKYRENEDEKIRKIPKEFDEFVATTEEEYLKMGREHTKKDRKISRFEVIALEKTLNNHAVCWCKIWNSGENLGHMSRIISSKISTSENRADMYCLYKDHKAEPGKTRPVVTGCSSDTLGLSNSVSDVLESVANSEDEPYEVISSEDMLAATKVFNEKYMERKKVWEERRRRKMDCERCKFEEIYARCHPGTPMTRKEIREDLKERCDAKLREDDEFKMRLKKDCDECGEGISEKELEICLLGNDVVALFPSIKSQNTGKIVRKRVIRSPLKFDGFNWRQGARYVVMNKHLTSDLQELWGVLPFRRKTQGVEPGMSNRYVHSSKETEDDLNARWVFPNPNPTEHQIRLILGRVCEIAVRTIFQNFSYRFGGETFQQSEGGPIGARVTMACARLVMQDWGESYRRILTEAELLVDFLRGYVDDGRQISTCLAPGMRFNREKMKFEITKEGLEEDKISTESVNARMARLCLPAMNAINPDLVFTMEIPEDFPLCRLPTLDFLMWLEGWGGNHTYFEKAMKTPFLLMQRSAMGEQQKSSILSNELVRRLSNINHEKIEKAEITEVIEKFIKQMKTSGYGLKQTREITISGIKGWKGKIKRREKEGKGFYREGKTTLKARVRKKLVEKENWYREKEEEEVEKDLGESIKGG